MPCLKEAPSCLVHYRTVSAFRFIKPFLIAGGEELERFANMGSGALCANGM